MQKNQTFETKDATFYYGPISRRVYLCRLSKDADVVAMAATLVSVGTEHQLTKIIAKIRSSAAKTLLATDLAFVQEAIIPHYYEREQSTEAAVFCCRYLAPERAVVEEDVLRTIDDVLHVALSRSTAVPPALLVPVGIASPSRFAPFVERQEGPTSSSVTSQPTGAPVIETCDVSEASEVAAFIGSEFASYPFPTYDASYVVNCMNDNVTYFCIREQRPSTDGAETSPQRKGRIIALSALERDRENLAAEVTDFATAAEYQGKGLARSLLLHMEAQLMKEKYRTSFSIARAEVAAINILFARCGYWFGGRLRNNTEIGGGIRNMNVWSKTLGS